MAFEHREGQGSLFKNDKKNERQPDFKGTIMIKGILYNVSAWSRTSQNGREYISLQAEEKQEEDRQFRTGQGQPRQGGQHVESAPYPVPSPALDDLPPATGEDEDLPF